MKGKDDWLSERVVTYVRTRREVVENHAAEGRSWSKTFKSVPEAEVTCTVRLFVDVGRLLDRLAERAARSKGGRAVLGNGAVVVKRVGPKTEVPL